MSKQIIKFRAWDTENKIFGFLNEDFLFEFKDFKHYTNVYEFSQLFQNPVKYKLLQFTGLTDKNGVEIYEGDILESSENERLFKWLVVFKNGCLGIQNILASRILGRFYPIDSEYLFKDRQKIGTIFENPELLEVSDE